MAPPSFRRGTMCPGTRRLWLSVCICAVIVGAAAFQPPAPFFRTTAFSRFDRSPSSRASAAGGSSTYSAPRNSLGLLRRMSRSAKDSEEDESWDSPEDYEAYGQSDKDASSSAAAPKLGIDIGAQLNPMTDADAASLRAEGAEAIEEAFSARLDEISDLKATVKEDFEKSKEAMAFASKLRANEETDKLMSKIDKLSGDFLASNEALRMGTKNAADADRRMGERGEGVELGSWGVDGFGRVVVTSSSAAGGSGLLGGVEASIEKAARDVESAADGFKVAPAESRVLVLCDENQDPSAKKIIDRFGSLLEAAFDDSIIIDRVSTSSPAPLGGLNAQTAIIVASTVNGKSSADTLLDRILRRTVGGAGGKIGAPPTHIICISSLGTERTDKFPYSMQNLMGGKLTKRREVEEAVLNVIKRRVAGSQVPLDYTVVKCGDVVEDISTKSSLEIMPGDTLDGEVGVEAAARSLLQAVVFQPSARNATLSISGGWPTSGELSDRKWDDLFLRLNGPELFRISGLADTASGETELDARYDRLVQYVLEWGEMFEEGASGGTGLTTPVQLRPSHKDASEAEGSVRRSGVRILFLPTNTGTRYKSKDEERELERQTAGSTGPAGGSAASTAAAPRKKIPREGGVEVLVEETLDGDLRVRARRCGMDQDTVVKEISEKKIVKRLEEAISVWRNDYS